MSVGDEESDVIVSGVHRNGEGKVTETTTASVSLGGVLKWAAGILSALVLMTMGALASQTLAARDIDTKTQEQLGEATRDRTRTSEAQQANTAAVQGLTKALGDMPGKPYVDETAARAKNEAIERSTAYTDAQVSALRQESVQIARDVSWIREKQDEQGRDLKEGLKAIDRKLSDLPARVSP